MMPVLPIGHGREETVPSVVVSAPAGSAPARKDWAHAHAGLLAILMLSVLVAAGYALWRGNRGLDRERQELVDIDDT